MADSVGFQRPAQLDAEHVVTAADGAPLAVREVMPRKPRGPRVVVGHAMMVDARTLYRADRPSLVGSLLSAGLHCFVVNARGRDGKGRQPSRLDFGYDAHVEDVGACLRWLRARQDGPIALLGHSLFAHAVLAHLARHPETLGHSRSPLCGHVALACNLWLPSCDTSRRRRALKRAAMGFGDVAVGAGGQLPARSLRVGSCDEPARYWRDFRRFWLQDRFASGDGFDYRAAFARVSLPVLLVVSDGDAWMARPSDALRFTAPLPRREVWHLGPAQRRAGLTGLSPDHMGVVADPRCQPLWEQLASWLLSCA